MATKKYIWDFGSDVPIKSTIETAVRCDQSWLPTLRILYVLSGSLTIRVGTKTYNLGADGLLTINPYELFSIPENGSTVAIFDLDLKNIIQNNATGLRFECNSLTATSGEPFTTLKVLLARFIKFNVGGGQDMTLLNISLAYAIAHHLVAFFSVQDTVNHTENRANLQRIEGIVQYIRTNYSKRLMLKDVADHFFLSVPYMSRVFKQYFGATFTDYLTDVRLSHALQDLLTTQKSIDVLAEEHGFASTRSFNTSFKQKYTLTPSAYRKQNTSHSRPSPEAISGNTDFVHQHNLELLARYLSGPEPYEETPQEGYLAQQMADVPPCDTTQRGTPLRHTFKNLISIGRAVHILLAENQQILRQTQQDIGFKYIIFHGLLDDEMMVYGEDEYGNIDLNFSYVNMVIDFLRSIGLRPFIELSFMPKKLATKAARTKYYRESCISLPKDIGRWNGLVRGLVNHLNSRYGADEVAQWPFSLWNLPDSSESMFGFGGVQPYFEFYDQTWQTVKACNPNIRFGGPSCLTETAEDGTFMSQFMQLCRSRACLPDFYQYHFFPMRVESQNLGDVKLVDRHLVYRPGPNALQDSIAMVRKNMHSWAGDIDTLYITEWNSSISHRELLMDTSFQAAYIVKNILENYDSVDGLCYWVLSDSIDEVRLTNELFHGGLGLFTYNGVRKASYYAFKLLARLGNTKLADGNGYFITRSRAGLQILLYNYHHFSSLYANGELFDMTFTNRYTPFPNPVRKKFVLPLTGLPTEQYTITETILSQQHGSSFDKWVELGALPLEAPEEVEYLKALSLPGMKKRRLSAENGQLTISCTLEPHEVRLVEIRTQY